MNVKFITQKKLYWQITLYELWLSVKWYFIFKKRTEKQFLKNNLEREALAIKQYGFGGFIVPNNDIVLLHSGEQIKLHKRIQYPGIKAKKWSYKVDEKFNKNIKNKFQEM